MQAIIHQLAQFMYAFIRWVGAASIDTRTLASAVAQHATPAAVELMVLVSVCTIGSITFGLWTRGRLRTAAATRVRANRYAAAISGFSEFQQTKMRLAKALSPNDAVATVRAGETRKRVETKVIDVAPYNEQHMIDLLARFKWYLKSSTPIKTKDTHLERRGDDLYSVTETESYVHLVFERDLEDPNIDRIKTLEREYFSIVIPNIPSYAGPIIVGFLGIFTGPGFIIVLGLCIWWGVNISKRRVETEETISRLRARQIDILEECDRL